ncbi:MAG: DEAD/DEAH box helicase family protein [Acidimicrobiia bacterium]
MGDDGNFDRVQRWWFAQRELRPGKLISAVVAAARRGVVIAAPFMQRRELDVLLRAVDPSVRVSVITNWNEAALRNGATDPTVYELLRNRPNTTLAHNPWLHAKYYRGDGVVATGSANLTRAGFGSGFGTDNLESIVPISFDTPYAQQLEAAVHFAAPISEEQYQWALATFREHALEAGTAPLDPSLVSIWDHQKEALDALEATRLFGQDRGLVVMATGTGKTYTAALDAARVAGDGRVLFIAHQREILEQAATTFAAALDDPSVAWFVGRRSAEGIESAQVVFATWGRFEAFRRKFGHEPFAPDAFDYVVVDEAHHAPAPTHARTIEGLDPRFMLALTATPDRLDDGGVERSGDGKVESLFGAPVYELALEDALARGILAPVDYRLIADDLDAQLAEMAITEQWSKERLNRDLFVPRHDAEVARIIGDHAQELGNPRSIVFCSSIDHANAMAAQLPGAEALHSMLPKRVREDIVDRFRSGELATVVTIDLFNEGIDVPEVDLVVFLRSTASKRIWLQQLGRGLRKTDHKAGVRVLDFTASVERIREVDAVRRNFATARQRAGSEPERRATLRLDTSRIEFTEHALAIVDALHRMETARREPRDLTEAIAGLYEWAREHHMVDGHRYTDADRERWYPSAAHISAACNAGYTWGPRRWIAATGDRGIGGVHDALGLAPRPERRDIETIEDAVEGLYEWAAEHLLIDSVPFTDADRAHWAPMAREVAAASRAGYTWSLPKWFGVLGDTGLGALHAAIGVRPSRIKTMTQAVEGIYEWAAMHVRIDGKAFNDEHRRTWYPTVRHLAMASSDHMTWSPTSWFAHTGDQGIMGVHAALGLPELEIRPGHRRMNVEVVDGDRTADRLMQRMQSARSDNRSLSSRESRNSPGACR